MSPRIEKIRAELSAQRGGDLIVSREFLRELVDDYDTLSALTNAVIMPVEIYHTHDVWCEVRRTLAKYAETEGSRYVLPLVVVQATLSAVDKLIKRRIAKRTAQ